ncbi:MAG: hypothetical protein KF692_02595 [Cryobacterium sp.]|nr:hypothetical protein [Cryobacterium sp.]
MRMPTVLSGAELPEQELISATLDGELQRVGDAFCPIDTVVGVSQRAASVAACAPDWAIAERLTAAWIYGAIPGLPRPLQLSVDSRIRLHPISTRFVVYREVVVDEGDLAVIGGMPVTTALRTAIDLARSFAHFSGRHEDVVSRLAAVGEFSLAECVDAIDARRNLPNKHAALQRLRRSLADRQPAFTR